MGKVIGISPKINKWQKKKKTHTHMKKSLTLQIKSTIRKKKPTTMSTTSHLLG
jgi:hypothetical protein